MNSMYTYISDFCHKVIITVKNDMIDFVYNIPTKAENKTGVIANGFEYSFSLQPLSNFNLSIKLSLTNNLSLICK